MLKINFDLKSAVYLYILLSVLVLFSVLIGTRETSVGTDTQNYADFFFMVRESFHSSRFEFFYKVLTLSVSYFSDSLSLYFAIIYLIFNFCYLAFFYCAAGDERKPQYLLVLFGFMCASSWYIVATTNGLRQGLSLPFLYFSLLYFSDNKYVRSFFFLLASLGFHKAVSLVIPFFLMVYLRTNIVFLVFIFSSLLYFFGFTEIILRLISSIMPVDIYDYIVSYGAEADKWVGFQLGFFVYTIFWGVAGYILREFVKGEWLPAYSRAWKFYCILMLPYFYFGFGAYSNRYAFIGWLFLPVVQTIFVVGSALDRVLKIAIVLMVLVFGLCSYATYLLGIWN